jgi:hypothetical protein
MVWAGKGTPLVTSLSFFCLVDTQGQEEEGLGGEGWMGKVVQWAWQVKV